MRSHGDSVSRGLAAPRKIPKISNIISAKSGSPLGDPRRTSRDRLIIFSRYPVPGRTKTRLIPGLGPVGAADLHRRLTEKTLETVRQFSRNRDLGVEICFDGGNRYKIRKWLGAGLILSRQSPGDLGNRMHAAFLRAFQSGCPRVILIGTDIPGLRERHLREALETLKDYDMVLGPSTDGGYWLIGLRYPVNVFRSIPWGERTVLDHTVSQANSLGLKLRLLDPLVDIDTPADLRSWMPDQGLQVPYLSVIIPALNEEANIHKAIHSARSEEAEIIVVDGGSRDRTAARALEKGVKVLRGPPGRARQQNLGALACHGGILLFLHADTVLPKNYIHLIFDTLMDPRVIAGGFRFRTDAVHPFMKVIEASVDIRSRLFQLPYGDQGLFTRKSIFTAVKGFPEVPVAEDLLFVRGLRRIGRIKIAPAYATTSARRWHKLGLLRTTFFNILILSGCFLGLSPERLTFIHRLSMKKKRPVQ